MAVLADAETPVPLEVALSSDITLVKGVLVVTQIIETVNIDESAIMAT